MDNPLGDGVLAYFGWPQAHEDDAERAVRAGLSLAEAVGGLDAHPEVRLQPRVWWRPTALAALARAQNVVPRYGDTLHELNANALCDWFEDHGPVGSEPLIRMLCRTQPMQWSRCDRSSARRS